MALTRAQLLMGNSSQGVVLASQTQGVRQGVGVIIAADGTISFDSVTATGVLKTNNPAAYNAYVWPTTLGAVGQQLQLGAGGALSWEDPDQIPWTAKGQLIAGTGVGTSTILNVGADGSILIADSTQASGLGYTTNFVATTGATSAANLPAGATGLRPVTPSTGAFRYNSTTTSLEFYNGSSWETVASSSTNSFVEQTSTTGAAVMPAGTQLQRPGGPAGGFLRFNDDTDHMEFWNGTSWQEVASGNSPTPPIPATIVSSVTGTLPITVATGTTTPVIAINAATTAAPGSVQLAAAADSQAGTSATLASTPAFSVPKDASGMTGSAYIPAGSTAQRPTASNYTGQFRYNTQIPQLEYSDGAAWQPVSPAPTLPASLAQAQAGTLTTVYSSPQTAVPKDASGMTGSAYIPAGSTAQRPTASNYTGQFRYNTQIPQLEYSDGTTWLPVSPASISPASLAQAQAGTLTTVYSSPQTAVPKDASGMTGSAYLPAGNTAQRPVAGAYTGQFRYNTQIPQLEYSDGTSWLGLGGLAAATLAQAQAGTLTSVAATPQTAVPKDASGMTGAALIPGGTDAQRPGTPSAGMLRWNTDPASTIGNRLEVYDASIPSWLKLAYFVSNPTFPDYTVSNGELLSGTLQCNNFTVPGGVSATINGFFQVLATGNVNIDGSLNGDTLGPFGAKPFSTTIPNAMILYIGPGFGLGGGSTTVGGLEYSPMVSLAGSGGSGAFISNQTGGTTGGGTGTGGSAGGSFICRSYKTISVTGSISLNGGNGLVTDRATPMWVSGPGGGSGGVCILQAEGNCTNSGTISAVGGDGDGPHNAGAGGGGGGGGIVIVQSNGGTATLGSVNVNGGAGAGGANTQLGGGGGGGCGGFGGDGGSGTPSGFNGQTGIASTVGSPFIG